jgi:16S rRNA (uracil1498-N3)-methyltransferase
MADDKVVSPRLAGSAGRARPLPRLFVDADLRDGARVALSVEQAHYLGNVLRLEAGDSVLAFNGRDGEWRARLEVETRKRTSLACEMLVRPQPAAGDCWLLFAPLKSARLDYVVQKAVEMGASRVIPTITERTQVTRFNAERARANMIEAAEQCGILAMPVLDEEARLSAVIARLEPQRRLIFCDEDAEASNPLAALAGLPRGGPLALVIGPEGGFSPSERALLLDRAGTVRLSLGPRILRADTAAVAALAIIQAVAGDWV